NRIMELTEKVLDNHDLISSGIERVKSSDRLDKTNIGELGKLVSDNKESLIEIITCLSFQDLTGQKINKIMEMMRDVESKILELIVTFGLKANNEKASMDEATSPLLNELKKPVSDDLKQDLVDDMLKKFGF
ncbi:MAG: protein phosphatase CheZ, partial [Nitrospirota bacterium]